MMISIGISKVLVTQKNRGKYLNSKTADLI